MKRNIQDELRELEAEGDHLLAFLIALTFASFSVAGSVVILSRL